VSAVPERAPKSEADRSISKQVRGSTLLLSGRGCSLLLNLLTQVVIIRSLSKSDYGLLSYVLCAVDLLSITAVLCMDKTFSRFGAIYHEQNDRPRLAGTLLLGLMMPVVLGGLMIGGIWGLAQWFPSLVPLDETTWPLMIILVMLIPSNGIASVALSLMTVVRGAREVFFRKHLLGPILKLALVGAVLMSGGQLNGVAWALLIGSLLMLAIDLWLCVKLAREERLLECYVSRDVIVPVKELLSFSLPLLVSDLAYQARGTLLIVMLGSMATAEDAAAFRAASSLVRINELVLMNFMVMFVPLASRLYSTGKTADFWRMQEQTNLWVLVMSFPFYAACVTLARPAVLAMYGSAYADVVPLMILLSAGYFCKATFGFNGLVLRVLGRMRTLLIIEAVVAVATIGAAIALMPQGAMGACLAALIGFGIQCLLKHIAVRRTSGYQTFGDQLWLQTSIVSLAALLAIVSWTANLGWIDGALLAVTASLTVLAISRRKLAIDESFPELKKLKVLSRFLAPAPGWPKGRPTTNESSTMRIGYMMSRFPKLTETFVLREMIEMERLGIPVEVYPLQREKASTVHPEAVPFVDRARFTPWMNATILLCCLRTFCRKPLVVLRTLTTLIKANWGSRRYLSGAILFFPKALYLAEVMRRDRITHLHAHFASHPAMVGWVIHQLTGLPYSFTAHGSDLHRDRHMLREKVDDAAFVATISDYNRNLILDECEHAPQSKVHVVHCGIDSGVFPERDSPTPFDQDNGPLQLACIGTLHEVKGQEYLLRACHLLQERGIEYRCHLIGDGPDLSELTRLVNELNLTESVVFHGRLTSDEIREVIREVDLIVAPSVPTSDGRREGIPVVLMEGMASGLVAVASDLSGIPELVIPGKTGVLCPPRDSREIADSIEALAASRDLREHLAAGGLAIVREEFDVARNTRLLLELIENSRAQHDSRLQDGEMSEEAIPSEAKEELCHS